MGYSFRPPGLAERLVYVTGIPTFMAALAIALFLHGRLRKPPAALESS